MTAPSSPNPPQPRSDPGIASAEDGLVMLDGPNGVAVTMTAKAAAQTGRNLIDASIVADRQIADRPGSTVDWSSVLEGANEVAQALSTSRILAMMMADIAADPSEFLWQRFVTNRRLLRLPRYLPRGTSSPMPIPIAAERTRVLDATRTLKMARSAHAYVRGNTAKFYEWLAQSPAAARVPEGPSVWICGDCHLGNLGPIVSGGGQVDIQIRDLDQAVIGNPAHDLVRLGLSLATAARGSDLPGVTTALMVQEMVEGYASAMNDPTSGDPGTEPDAVRSVRRKAWNRRWRHLAKDRLDGNEPRIPMGRKFWPLTPEEHDALDALFNDEDVMQRILAFERHDEDRTVRMIDAAYWMKGCSSLGLLRYAVLIEIRSAKGRPSYALVDIKEATAPVAPAYRDATMPEDNAHRVFAAAKALSPHLGERMIPVQMMARSLFIRELAPQDLKLEIDQFTESQAARAARYLAFVVGKGHARQMDHITRHEWRERLEADRRTSIDAPSWLWESVVALAGRHEAGYLDHCRRYALAA